MQITRRLVKLREITRGYKDSGENGVVGFNGQLNIRPAYQREFVYKDKQRDAVIDTITKGFPLNTIYWAKNEDGSYEIIDGQQRTISFCRYINNGFAINFRSWVNLTQEEKDKILDYEVDVYVCEGSEADKLNWFRTINIAGEKLNEQELLNATYTGPWLSDAKRYFSKTDCAAAKIADKLVNGVPIRQDYLATALYWISNGETETYMSTHQNDFDAKPLWDYFKAVIDWVNAKFTVYRKEMKGLPWGIIYNKHKDDTLNPVQLEERIKALMSDEEVTSKKGIYFYVLTNDTKFLSLRAFSDEIKRTVYERQEHQCAICEKEFEYKDMHGDHITPWTRGGKTTLENCQMLCVKCNLQKGSRQQ